MSISGIRVMNRSAVVVFRVVTAGASTYLGASTDQREIRPVIDPKPPALVVGEMHVEPVDLVERQQVDVALDLVDR